MKHIVLIACAFMLSSCAFMEADVTRFHDSAGLRAPANVYVMPQGPQAGSLEFATYARDVGREMQALGFMPVTSEGQADYVVFLDYGVGGGREVVQSTPVYGRVGGDTVYNAGVYTSSTYGDYGTYSGTTTTPSRYGVVGTDVTSHTEYEKGFKLRIARIQGSGFGNSVFEGTVKSSGQSSTFAAMSACMIKAMFKDFPGENGKTQSVVIPTDECARS